MLQLRSLVQLLTETTANDQKIFQGLIPNQDFLRLQMEFGKSADDFLHKGSTIMRVMGVFLRGGKFRPWSTAWSV